MTERVFPFSDDRSNKFWAITQLATGYTVRFGRQGTAGQTQSKDFATAQEAEQASAKRIFRKAQKTFDHEHCLDRPSTVMSTAEAVSVGYAAGLHASYYDGGAPAPDHLVQSLVGSAIKDTAEDLKKLRHYFNHVVQGRRGKSWQSYYAARHHLD